MIIKLTCDDGTPLWINFDHVYYFQGGPGSYPYTLIYGAEDFKVKETPEQIENLITVYRLTVI